MDARTAISRAVRTARGDTDRAPWLRSLGLDWHTQALYRLECGTIAPARVADLARVGVLSPEVALLGLAWCLRSSVEYARGVAADPVAFAGLVGEWRADPASLTAWCALCLTAETGAR